MLYDTYTCILSNVLADTFFRWRDSVAWRHSRLHCCLLSRLVVPVSAFLVRLLLSFRLRAARCSILGPLLVTIYMNDIHKSSDKFDFNLYADDTLLCSKINKFKGSNINNTNNMINEDISHITAWLETNKLSLNIDKRKAMT